MKKHLSIFLSLFLPLFAASASEAAPSADALRAEADALAADIAARLGSSVRPGVPFPGYRPPVAPDADPFAAIDPDALENDKNEFARMSTRRSKGNSSGHPLTPNDVSILADTLPRLTNLAAAADAFATPGYRSPSPAWSPPPTAPLRTRRTSSNRASSMPLSLPVSFSNASFSPTTKATPPPSSPTLPASGPSPTSFSANPLPSAPRWL